MTQKRKVLLVTLGLIFFSGLIISFKSHQVTSDYRLELEKQKEQDVSYWAAEVLMEKIKILEASVSTLDKSTVAILQRMDVRYFAYAFKVKGQWKIKWKIIGDIAKNAVIKEVNSISFSELSGSQRNWFNGNEKVALISPVEIAKSEQLNHGFLVFGLNPDFFSGVLKADPHFEIFTFSGKQAKSLIKNKSMDWLIDSGLMTRKAPTQALSLDHKGVQYMAASYFSSDIQLWLVRLRESQMSPFLESSTFNYFLIAMVLCLGLVLVLFSQLLNFSESLSAQQMRDSQSSGFSLFVEKLKRKTQRLGSRFSQKKDSTPTVTNDSSWMEGCDLSEGAETIDDFSAWVEAVLTGYKKRILKSGITLHSNISEGISVRCHAQPTKEFISRLLENSLQSLILEDVKTINIELIERDSQLILSYADSRTRNLPSIEEPSYLLEVENPLEDINGIIAYGRWLFSDKLHSATDELSVDLDMERVDRALSAEDLSSIQLNRFEIKEDDEVGLDHFEFKAVTPAAVLAESEAKEENSDSPAKSIDEIISSFELNSIGFEDEVEVEAEDPTVEELPLVAEDEELKQSIVAEKEMIQFEAGEFKIKIRSPKKRDTDVHS